MWCSIQYSKSNYKWTIALHPYLARDILIISGNIKDGIILIVSANFL